MYMKCPDTTVIRDLGFALFACQGFDGDVAPRGRDSPMVLMGHDRRAAQPGSTRDPSPTPTRAPTTAHSCAPRSVWPCLRSRFGNRSWSRFSVAYRSY
jgi:hypothetical protein